MPKNHVIYSIKMLFNNLFIRSFKPQIDSPILRGLNVSQNYSAYWGLSKIQKLQNTAI
jgi:hypothetical protein